MMKLIKNSVKKVVTGLRWRTIPDGLYCFNYHRIGDATNTQYDSDIYSCDSETFSSHLRFYREHFDLITIDNLLDIVDNKKRIDKKLALISFDDGYIDNYKNAYPILKENDVSAIFFVPTDYVGNTTTPWWDEIAWMVRNTTQKAVSLDQWGEAVLIDTENLDLTIRNVLLLVKKTQRMKMDDILSQLRTSLKCRLDSRENKLFMDWEQLNEMRDNGMSIGSHTHSHEILSHIDSKAQLNELSLSREILKNKLGTSVTSFAYPVGRKGTYNEKTIEHLQSCGYKLAFTQLLGMNPVPRENRYELRRFPVDGNIAAENIPQLICLN
jgi:peptidoglycan/xylan/chitin deacetylase (PgdA/CDA1 family)